MPADTTRVSAAAKSRRHPKKELDEDRFDSTHAREIELKRSRGEISCAECRRLKIRCDKSIPCKSCQRRGCAALCPNGSLATGQGTRFVLAATEHLHRRIAKMKERIRELEDALAILQAKSSNEPHPLLRDDLVRVDAEPEEEEASECMQTTPTDVMDAFGTLSVSEHGMSRFFGPTGGTEYLLNGHDYTSDDGSNSPSARDSMTPPISGELTRFSTSFPFTPIGTTGDVRQLIESHLPTWDRAMHLTESYLTNAAWLFQGLTREQLMDEMMPIIYKRPDAKPCTFQDYSGPHDLALLFLVFAVGALVDLNQEPYNAEGEHYYILGKAALCLQPVLERPSLVAIQSLWLMGIYTAMGVGEARGSDTTLETTWSLEALAAQLAQSIGLHRDSARWGLPHELVERRRILFWDLFINDMWQSLTTGRPPSFSRDYIDCKYPGSTAAVGGSPADEEMDEDRELETWVPRFAMQCVAEVATRTLAAEPPTYTQIMDLDRRVRDFPVPPEVVAVVEEIKPPASEEEPIPISLSFQRMVMSHCREIILLFIHRSFFAQAIIDCPSNPLRSNYAPSFLASYRASVTILRTIKNQYDNHPMLSARFWLIWTYAFSAVVVFGTVVTRGPRSPLAGSAVQQLDMGCELFHKAAVHSRRAAKALPILNRLRDKAHAALSQAAHDPTRDGALWNIKVEDDGDDELEIYAGRTRLVESKRPSPSPTTSMAEARHVPSQLVYPGSASASSGPGGQRGQSINPPPVLPSLPNLQLGDPNPPQPPSHHSKWMNSEGVQRHAYASYPQQQHPPQPREPPFYASGSSYSHAHPHSHSRSEVAYPPWSPQSAPPVSRVPQGYPPMQTIPPPQHRQYAELISPHSYHSPSTPSDYMPAPAAAPPSSQERTVLPPMQQQPSPHPPGSQQYLPPQELVNLGLAARDSRLDQRWTAFMHDNGFLDGMNQQY